MPSTSPITDDEAASLFEQYESADEPNRELLRAGLLEFDAQRTERVKRERESHFEKLYTDPAYFEEISASPQIRAAAEVNPFPDAVKFRAANQAFLAHELGMDPEALADTYEVQRDGYAQAKFGKIEPVTDEAFHGLVRGEYQTVQRKREALQSIPSAIAKARIDGAEGISTADLVNSWKEKNFDLIKPGEETQLLQTAKAIFDETDAWMREAAPEARSALDAMRSFAQGADVDPDTELGDLATGQAKGGIDTLAADLTRLDRDERMRVYAMAALSADGDRKGYFQQLAESIERGIYTGLQGVNRMTVTQGIARELRILRRAEDGNAVLQNGRVLDKRPVGFVAPDREEITPDRAQELIVEREQKLAELDIASELRQIALGEIDPIAPINEGIIGKLEKGTYDLAGSLPIMSLTAIPIAGVPLAMTAYTGMEFDRMRMQYPDTPIEEISAMATVSGAAQGAIDRMQFNLLRGSFGETLAGLTLPNSPYMARVIARTATLGAKEYGQETIQNLTPIVVEEIGRALGADIPDRDWEKEFEVFEETQVDTFFALLPLVLLGAGGISVREWQRGKQFLSDVDALTQVGIDRGSAESIAAEEDPDKAQAAFQTAWQAVPAETKAAFVAKVDAASRGARQSQDSAELPTLESGVTESGETQWTVRDTAGKAIYTTTDEDAATQAYANATSERFSAVRAAVSEMVRFYESKNAEAGRGDAQTFEVSDKAKTGQGSVDAGETTIEQLSERMRIAGMSADTLLDQVRILGENVTDLRDGVFRDTIKLHRGANPLTVVEERVEGETKRAIAEGRVTMDWLRQQVADYELASGEALLAESEQSVIEAVSTLGQAYVAGRLRDDRLPSGLVGYFRQLIQYFKHVFARAGRLRKAIVEGKVKGDFEQFLAESVGLDESAQIGVARDAELATSFSIAPADYTARIESELKKLDTDPELRRQRAEIAIKDLRKVSDKIRRPVVAADYDPEPAVDQIEQDRASGIADLRAEQESEKEQAGLDITEQFADRIENAKTEATKRALNREAKARLTERRKAIDAKYTEREKAINATARADKAQTRREADLAKRGAREEADSANSRDDIITATGALEAILSVLPEDARGRVGGYKHLLELTTNKARAKFLLDRVAKVEKEFESYLRKEYSTQIEKLLKASKPQKSTSGVRKSRLGPEAQKVADSALRAIYMDEDATAARMSQIEAAIDAGDTSQFLVDEWGILNTFGDLKNRSASSLSEGRDWLRETFRDGARKRRVDQEARLEEIRGIQSEIASALGVPETPENFSNENKTILQNFRELGVEFLNDHASFEQFLRAVLPGMDGIVSQFATRMRKADNGATDSELADRQAFLAALKSAAKTSGVSSSRALVNLKTPHENVATALVGRIVKKERFTVEQAEKITRGEILDHGLSRDDVSALREALVSREENLADQEFDQMMGGNENARLREGSQFVSIDRVLKAGEMKPISMTRGQAIQILLSWAQPDVRAKMERGGWMQSSIDSLNSFIAQDGVAQSVHEFLRDFYAASADRVNPVYARVFGMNIPQVENYAPSRFKHSGSVQEIGPDGSPVASGGTPGFMKARVNHSAPIAAADALEVFSEHILQQSHWVNFAELARDFRSVFANGDVRQAIEAAHGKSILSQVDSWAKLMEKRGGDRAREAAWMNQWIGALISGKAVASLGFNLRTIAMQTDSAMRFIFAMNPAEIMRALSNPSQIAQAVPKVWASDSVKRRVLAGMSPEVQFAFRRAAARPGIGAAVAHASMSPINYMDASFTTLGSAIVFTNAYNQAKADGATNAAAETIALDAVDAAIYRFAQPLGFGSKSLVENRGNTFLRIFMLFLSDARLKTGIMIDAGRGIARGENIAGNIKALATVEAMALISHIIGAAYRDAFSDDEDEDIWSAGGFAKAAAMAPFQGLLFVGSVADVTLNALTKQKFFQPSRDPLVDAVSRGQRAVSNIDDTFNFDDPDAMLKQWDNLARAAAVSPQLASGAAAVNLAKPFVGAYENINEDE